MSPDRSSAASPELSLSDVHAALAYYFDNVEEISHTTFIGNDRTRRFNCARGFLPN